MSFDPSRSTLGGNSAVAGEAQSAAARPQPSPSLPGIELRGVTHRYASQSGAVHALEPIDLQIEAGSFVAILGSSGCGRTAPLRIVSCLLGASGGQVQFAGESSAAAR